MPLPEELRPKGEAEGVDNNSTKNLDLIREALKQLIQTPEFITAVSNNRRLPNNVSRLSVYSYYRPEFALQVKLVIDEMIETKRDKEWRYLDFPDLRPRTLYQRIFQSIKYLVDNLDPDGKYAAFKKITVLSDKVSKTGVRLSWVRDMLDGREFKATDVTLDYKMQQWKLEIDKFLTDTTKKVLHLKSLALTSEEIESLRVSLEIPGLYPFISEREIKIIKSDEMIAGEEEK